jgi:hypothetical protein
VREHAVFADEGDDIGDRAQRGERCSFDEEVAEGLGDAVGAADDAADAPGKLEGDTGAAEVGIGVGGGRGCGRGEGEGSGFGVQGSAGRRLLSS